LFDQKYLNFLLQFIIIENCRRTCLITFALISLDGSEGLSDSRLTLELRALLAFELTVLLVVGADLAR